MPNRLLVAAVALFSTTAWPQTQAPLWASHPNVVGFEKIVNDRLARAETAIQQITSRQGPRTIDNTLVPFDHAIEEINGAMYLSTLISEVHPQASFRDHATETLRKASAAQTALSLNHAVYAALASLNIAQSDPKTRYYVERQLLEFRLAGVDKDEATRTQLRKLNDELTNEQAMFERNIADDQRKVEVKDGHELEGLPQDYIERHKPAADGKIYVSTNYPDAFPALKFSNSEEFRRRLYEAFRSRAYPQNKDVLESMMKTRYAIATLLGYPSWADYNAADKMIRTGENIGRFIARVDSAARPIEEREFHMLLGQKQKSEPSAKELPDYDYSYLQELVRRADFDFDSQQVRPYLPFREVKKGIMDTTATLFQVSFRQETDITLWDPTIETWDVIDGGKMIGRFYLDMHPRPGKFTHAEMAPVLDGVRGRQLPEAILVCNFPQPTSDDPGLMEYDDVVTFFHEFGHLMHHILGGQQPWAGISGISMESDFVEAPSQMLEEWMHSPQVLASFARHYKTGEPIPAQLVAAMNHASAFGRATWVASQDSFTALSYDIYRDQPQNVDFDALTISEEKRYTLFTPLAGAHYYTSFGHLAGYSSAYYTYLWDKVIAEDFFNQFNRSNLLAGPTPMRYRHMVLEPGGSVSANDLVKNFLGREQNMDAFRDWMSEEFRPASADRQASN